MMLKQYDTALTELSGIVDELADADKAAKTEFRSRLLRLVHSPKLRPFASSTQIGIKCRLTIDPGNGDWKRGLMPLASGMAMSYSSFRPDRVLAKEVATYLFQKNGRAAQITHSDDVASDAWLVTAFVGALNCYPNAPDMETGIALSGLRNTFVDWPEVRSGTALHVGIGIDKTILTRTAPPRGFGIDDLAQIHVLIGVDIYGEAV